LVPHNVPAAIAALLLTPAIHLLTADAEPIDSTLKRADHATAGAGQQTDAPIDGGRS
jgi:hypothetical protein